MATVINYGDQNYNPTMVQAMPSRGWMSGSKSLTTGGTFDLFHIDGILIYRGAVAVLGAVQPTIAGAGLNVRIDIFADSSGVTLMPQEDLGSGSIRDLLPAASVCPAGLTSMIIGYNGFHFKAQVTRISGSTTTITFCVSVLGYT